MQKHLKVTINGKQYSITTDENDSDVYTAASTVDSLLKNTGKNLSPVGDDRAAVVVALQLATDLAKNQRLFQVYEDRIGQLLALLSREA